MKRNAFSACIKFPHKNNNKKGEEKMKSFSEFLAESDWPSRSKKRKKADEASPKKSDSAVDDAVLAYRAGQDTLRRGGCDLPLRDRITRLEATLDHLLEGLIRQR